MTELEFYVCTTSLISRLGYVIDAGQSPLKSDDPHDSERRKWIERSLSAVAALSGVEIPWYRKNFQIDLNISEATQAALRKDWALLGGAYPVAGLRFSNGLAKVFAAKCCDGDDPVRLIGQFEQIHTDFMEFASRYILAISRYGESLCTLCFAFTDRQRFMQAKSVFGDRKGKGNYLKRTYTNCWLFDLNTLELVSTRGLAASALKMMESLSPSLARNKELQRINDWHPPSTLLTSGAIGIKTFLNYAQLFSRLLMEKQIRVTDTKAAGMSG